MTSKTSPVDESNQLLEQPNKVHMATDCNGNSFNKWRDGKFPSESSRADNYTQNTTNEDINDTAKLLEHLGEENTRNLAFFFCLLPKLLQSVVASALLVLAVEWQPLQDFIEKHVDSMIKSILVLIISCAVMMFVQFKGWFIVSQIISTLLMINLFWFIAAISFQSLIFSSPYTIMLCAVTLTITLLFLNVLTYYQKVTYKGCKIYGYAFIVPLMFLILSQPYYFWWYLQVAKEMKLEQNMEVNHEKIMSYPNYMKNVTAGIGLAAGMTLEIVFSLQQVVQSLKFKFGPGKNSGSFEP